MSTQSRSPNPSPPRGARPSVGRDLLVVASIAILTFAVSVLLELNERIVRAMVPLETWQIDELPITILALALAMAWFSWRRSREARAELDLRLAAQQALVESEEQYRSLFMENLSANFIASPEGRVRLSNPAAAQLLGVSSTGDQLLRGERVETSLLELRRSDGALVQAVAQLSARLSPAREAELHLYITDVSTVARMQVELERALDENRMLSQQSMQVQEEERRNLARELHDELGQSLNAIKVDAVNIRDNGQADPDIRRSALAIIEVSTQVYDVVRSLMQRLRPVALDDLGLRSAVQYGVDQWQRRHRTVRCRFDTEGELDGFSEQVNITLYRLVQECLTNVTKHAEAASVTISLKREGNQVRFDFEDDGRGFDPAGRKQGLGLIGLRERVESLGGRFEPQSAPGRGVRIRAVIPVQEESK
jgi:signal transduction histidine kinase